MHDVYRRLSGDADDNQSAARAQRPAYFDERRSQIHMVQRCDEKDEVICIAGFISELSSVDLNLRINKTSRRDRCRIEVWFDTDCGSEDTGEPRQHVSCAASDVNGDMPAASTNRARISDDEPSECIIVRPGMGRVDPAQEGVQDQRIFLRSHLQGALNTPVPATRVADDHASQIRCARTCRSSPRRCEL